MRQVPSTRTSRPVVFGQSYLLNTTAENLVALLGIYPYLRTLWSTSDGSFTRIRQSQLVNEMLESL